MAVAFDSKGTVAVAFGGYSSPQTNSSLTTGGSATCVVAFVVLNGLTGTNAVTGATWNGVSMSLIGSSSAAPHGSFTEIVYMFGLASPATGNQTFSVSVSGSTASSNIVSDIFSFTGSDLNTTNCFPPANVLTDSSTVSGTVYPASAFSVTTASGDAACAGMTSDISNFATTTATLINNDNSALVTTTAYGLASSSSTSIQFTGGTAGTNICAGVAFRIQKPVFIPYNPWPLAGPVIAQ